MCVVLMLIPIYMPPLLHSCGIQARWRDADNSGVLQLLLLQSYRIAVVDHPSHICLHSTSVSVHTF